MSPEPDVCVFDLDVTRHKSLVLASDGLWNMVRPQECIDIVHRIDKENENLVGHKYILHFNIEISDFEHISRLFIAIVCKVVFNFQEDDLSPTRPANTMVRCALDRWMARQLRADNTSVIVVMIDVPGERRERSASSASTVSISSSRLMSESEDEMSESELSDSDLIDSFAPDIDMEEDEESCDSGPSLPCFGGVGLMRTPPCGLTNGESKPRLRRLGSLKKLDSKTSCITKVTPRKPIFRPCLHGAGSAPSKLIGHSSHFRGICKSSPFARFRVIHRPSPLPAQQQQQQNSSNASFMDPGFKSPAIPFVKTPTKSEDQVLNNGASPQLVAGERTLRPKSPRLIGENLLSTGASGVIAGSSDDCHPSSAQKDPPNLAAKIKSPEVSSNPIATLNFAEPKEATSPKSPLKIDTMEGSPSAGLVSPIWPSSLEVEIEVDIALNGENVVPSPNRSDSPDTEATENIEHPKVITPKGLSGNKRKPVSPIPPKFTAKRLKSTTHKIAIVSPQKTTVIRTRGQLKSLSPHKNSSPRKNSTTRNESS